MARIRPTALAVVRRGEDLLVARSEDPFDGEVFFRPLGGGVEFGETAEAAVHRELREELGVGLGPVRLLGVLENIFTFAGRPHHEIVFVFAADVTEGWVYERDQVGRVLDEGSPVSWEPLAAFAAGDAVLYPEGVLALLTREQAPEPVPPAG